MKFNNNNVYISKTAQIGANVKIGDNTIIYDNVIIDDNSVICNNCILGEPLNDYYKNENYTNPTLHIGENALIRSHSILYAGSHMGAHFATGHRVTIREKSIFGTHCFVGTLSDVQGYVTFGNYCRLHSNVHIGQHSSIGNFVFIYPYAVLTNDPHPPSNVCMGCTIGDYTQIAVAATILPGINIGSNCLIAANALVNKNVEDFSVVGGNPAKRIGDINNIKSKEKEGSHYPWMYNFQRGMPWENIGYAAWLNSQKADII